MKILRLLEVVIVSSRQLNKLGPKYLAHLLGTLVNNVSRVRGFHSETKAVQINTITYLYRCHGDHIDPHRYRGTQQTGIPGWTSALHKFPPTNQT